MPPPRITPDQVREIVPQITAIEAAIPGGQKLVFPCEIGGQRYVVKVMGAPEIDEEEEPNAVEEVFARAEREVRILETCNSPHLPRIGAVPLTRVTHAGQRLLLFSEEFIESESLRTVLIRGRLTPREIIQLANDIAAAIDELWSQRKIHRDINPNNILRRTANGRFVLIDPGIAYDVGGDSLTRKGQIWHTAGYLAPELFNPLTRRDADLRSDFFLLGTVMYEAASGTHPFGLGALPPDHVYANIGTLNPPLVATIVPGFPACLDEIIQRLLSKHKHGRFRRADLLTEALKACLRSL